MKYVTNIMSSTQSHEETYTNEELRDREYIMDYAWRI